MLLTLTLTLKAVNKMAIDYEALERNRSGSMALFALVNDSDEIIELKLNWYAVGTFYRVNEAWQLTPSDPKAAEDAGQVFLDPERAIEFLDKWDTQDSEINDELEFYTASDEVLYEYFPAYKEARDFKRPMVSAAKASETGICPPATSDIMLNLKNRNKAVKNVGYGPLNPDRPNLDFWEAKADMWQTTVEEAKTSRCANCAMFIRTSKMLDCIENGLSQGDDENAWDSIDAGDLGYCEALDFKCASARTCDAWVAGGPVTDKDEED